MIKLRLIELLETYGEPVIKQGSLSEDEDYPDSFFTFFNDNVVEGNHYNNDAASFVWPFDVNYYSTDPIKVNTRLNDVRNLLRANGFIVSGKGGDIASDEPTHTGRGIRVFFIERNNEIGG